MKKARYLTSKEVAERFGTCTKTIQRLASKGLIGHLRLGGNYRFLPEHITAYEKKNTTKAHA